MLVGLKGTDGDDYCLTRYSVERWRKESAMKWRECLISVQIRQVCITGADGGN